MRILIIYPGHSHSTIDMATGYSDALKSLGHIVCDFNYHNQLAFYTGALEYWKQRNPEFKLSPSMAFVLASEQVIPMVADFVPDVVIIVCGLALHRQAFMLMDKLRVPYVLILSESPYADRIQTAIIEKTGVRLTFTNDKGSVLPMREATGKRIEYLPHSFNPEKHHPQEVNGEYCSDVYFFGTMWPERRALLYPLKRWAARWRREWVFKVDGVKPISKGTPTNLTANEDLINGYRGTRIALNHNRKAIGTNGDGKMLYLEPGQAWSLGPRAFEIAACGAFQLCDDTRPELREVFGDSVPTYTSLTDLRKQIDYYLNHESERVASAREAHKRVQECSFAKRAQEILLPYIEEVL